MLDLGNIGAAPPSRQANPFATCWTRPGALPLVLPDGETLQVICERLARSGWSGQIVGPHGAGKSTLLAHLQAPIGRAGLVPVTVRIDRSGGWDALVSATGLNEQVVVLIEGFERLTASSRRQALRVCRLNHCGYAVPTHRRLRFFSERLPVAATLSPTAETVSKLFDQLTKHRPTPVTRAQAIASYDRHAGDLRSVWFDLYNQHELTTRPHRTRMVQVA